MHFEILTEDQSGKIMLGYLSEKILGPNGAYHSWRIFAYKGIGRLPGNLRGKTDPGKRILLDWLPVILRGYGKSLPPESAVIVVADSDRKDCIAFRNELNSLLNRCDPAPDTLFRIAIEEGEAWLLGDRAALMAAYPKAKRSVLDSYLN